jgi:hypothetical protein
MLVAYSYRHRRNFEQLEMENNLKLVIKLHAFGSNQCRHIEHF